MTKAQVIDKLMEHFGADEKYRGFFTGEVERMVGEGNIVSEALWLELMKYFNNLT